MTDPYCDISFDEKIRIYSYDFLKCFVYINEIDNDYIFTKKLYSRLISTAHLLEDFLDFHGAKQNKAWYYYRELASVVRYLSLAGYSLRHISNRLHHYELKDEGDFKESGDVTVSFLVESLRKLAPVILEKAKELKIQIPEGSFDHANFPGVVTSYHLDYDIDDLNVKEQREYIVKISSEFLNISKSFGHFTFFKPYETSEIKDIIPLKVNEIEIRRFEMLFHNLQSSYDSYVSQTGGNKELKQLRDYLSIILHLLRIMGRLLHLYEQRFHDVGYKNVYREIVENLSGFVNLDTLLDRIVNYGLYYVCFFISSGRTIAQETLNSNIDQDSIKVGIPVTRGFHSRPSLMVAKIVQHFGGKVELVVGGDTFDAGSVLDIQWAGGKIQKENITEVEFKGDSRALHDIKILAGVNYGEDSMGKGIALPKELKYLK
ncbi:MAG: HPr family phosphocarrier protein [Desulfobacterales bacterium]|nr:HPr family phosphocarrier protein [Desulfobacterales bacterium]